MMNQIKYFNKYYLVHIFVIFSIFVVEIIRAGVKCTLSLISRLNELQGISLYRICTFQHE